MTTQLGKQDGGPTGTTTVPFCCQTCFAPMKLHASLKGLSKHNIEGNTRELESEPAPVSFDKVEQVELEELNLKGGNNNQGYEKIKLKEERATFQDLQNIDNVEKSPSEASQVAMSLFDFVSSRSDVDHPLCEGCTDLLLDRLDSELQNLQSKHAEQEALRRELDAISLQNDDSTLEEELKGLDKEEQDLLEEIRKAEEEHARLLEEQKELHDDLEDIKEKEESYWKEYNEYQRQLIEFDEQQETMEHKYEQTKLQLQVLKKRNVFNDSFHIWFDGHFGTINGFRLGRLPTVPVQWDEVNAAWGYTVLLLHIMVQRLEFKFEDYVLVPNGSQSRIHKVVGGKEVQRLPLYTLGGKIFSDTSKFDSGMEAFLDCLRQFKDCVDARDPHFKLPYTINGDTISDSVISLHVKLQHNTEENWTKSLKYMLTNLKWCLAWMCKQMVTQ